MNRAKGDIKFLQSIFDYDSVYINDIEADGGDIAKFCEDIQTNRAFVSGIKLFAPSGKSKTLCISTAV